MDSCLFQTFDAHQLEVRSVKQTKGSVLTASKDGVCKIWQPSSQPANMCDVRPHNEQQEICTVKTLVLYMYMWFENRGRSSKSSNAGLIYS